MSTDNPTDDQQEVEEPITDSDVKEMFLRDFFARQRELHKKSLVATANLASANLELILRTGLSEVAAKRVKTATGTTVDPVATDLIKQRLDANEAIVQRITQEILIDG